MNHFELVSEYKPTGDQPQAIKKLSDGFLEGNQFETLVGVTGSGKTFTCLLYTSPSPRDRTRSRMPSSA